MLYYSNFLNNTTFIAQIEFKPRKWKPNPLVPPPKPKREPIEINYLEDKRIARGGVPDREQLSYEPKNWKDELRGKFTVDKFEYVFDKAQQISATEDMAEQYLR